MFVHRRRSAAAVDRASSFQPFSFFLSSLGATFFFMFFLLPSRIVWGESAKLTHSLVHPLPRPRCAEFFPLNGVPKNRISGQTDGPAIKHCRTARGNPTGGGETGQTSDDDADRKNGRNDCERVRVPPCAPHCTYVRLYIYTWSSSVLRL